MAKSNSRNGSRQYFQFQNCLICALPQSYCRCQQNDILSCGHKKSSDRYAEQLTDALTEWTTTVLKPLQRYDKIPKPPNDFGIFFRYLTIITFYQSSSSDFFLSLLARCCFKLTNNVAIWFKTRGLTRSSIALYCLFLRPPIPIVFSSSSDNGFS